MFSDSSHVVNNLVPSRTGKPLTVVFTSNEDHAIQGNADWVLKEGVPPNMQGSLLGARPSKADIITYVMKTYFDAYVPGGIVFRTVPIRYERDELGEVLYDVATGIGYPTDTERYRKTTLMATDITKPYICIFSGVDRKDDGVGMAHPYMWISKSFHGNVHVRQIPNAMLKGIIWHIFHEMTHFFGLAHEVENPTSFLLYTPLWERLLDPSYRAPVISTSEKRQLEEKNILADVWYILKNQALVPREKLSISSYYDTEASMSSNPIIEKYFFQRRNTNKELPYTTLQWLHDGYPQFSKAEQQWLNGMYLQGGKVQELSIGNDYSPLYPSQIIPPDIRERILASPLWMDIIKRDTYGGVLNNTPVLRMWVIEGIEPSYKPTNIVMQSTEPWYFNYIFPLGIIISCLIILLAFYRIAKDMSSLSDYLLNVDTVASTRL